MELNAENICNALGINEADVVNIYPYGSRIYGTDDEFSDDDFIIVFKSSFIKSKDGQHNTFRNNAISSDDGKIQGVCYSRGGFIDAINNYEIGAWECLSLPEDKVIKAKWPFKIQKYEQKQMVKKIIEKASASWHIAMKAADYENYEQAEKGVFHAIRILMFGLQIKESQKVTDFTVANDLWKELMENEEEFTKKKAKKYMAMRDELMEKLRS